MLGDSDKNGSTPHVGERAPESADEQAETRKPRSGLPGEASILSEKTFTSPKGKRYRILRTKEIDPYDELGGSETKRR
jgi:hypothetical protein